MATYLPNYPLPLSYVSNEKIVYIKNDKMSI